MPQPSGYLWNPDHTLHQVHLELRFIPDGSVELVAIGYAETKRGELWRHHETFPAEHSGYSPTDAAHHLLLACHQDRPRTGDLLALALRGGSLWEDQELPWQ